MDFRYALRMLRKSPGVSAVIVLSLAIGIGANTAIFSVVDALLLRPLPFPNPDRLAVLWLRQPGIGITLDWPSPRHYVQLLKGTRSFEAIAISRGVNVNLTGLDQPRRVDVLATSSNLFQILGAKPLFGRLLLPEEDKPGRPQVAILSYAIWVRWYGSDPQIVGKSILLSGNPVVVAGVLSPEFQLTGETMHTVAATKRIEIYIPLPLGADAVERRGEDYTLTAQLKPGVSAQQAQADVDVIAGRIRDTDKRDRSFIISVVPLLDQVVGDVRRAVLVMLGAVALVLLIACANVANLLLSRAGARQKEMAIRTALGARPGSVIRQLLTESVLLGVLGGAAGLLLAWWSLRLLRTMNPGNIPRMESIGINGGVLAFTSVVSVFTGILFGIAPALRVARIDLNTSLRSGGRASQGAGGFAPGRHRLRALLVVTELSLSLMLLIGAGLLIRSFGRLASVAPGFNPDHVISMRLAAFGPKYRQPPPAQPVQQFYQQVAERIARLPGVISYGAVSVLPLTSLMAWAPLAIEGYTPAPGEELQIDLRVATSGYFHTMQIPLLRGRYFTGQDTPDAPPVVVVDEQMAQRFWPAGDAIGKKVTRPNGRSSTVVGVVGRVKQYGLDADTKVVTYLPHSQTPSGEMFVVARASADPSGLVSAMIREVRSVDAEVPVYDVQTMEGRLQTSLARQRFSMTMLAAFAGFALLLAAIGIYGVMSYIVTQGTHDIGVRIALGAQRRNILEMVVKQAMQLAGIGIAAGLAGAALLTRVMASLLFGVSPTDMVTFSFVAVFLAVIALAASYVPALRATRVDPIVALREE